MNDKRQSSNPKLPLFLKLYNLWHWMNWHTVYSVRGHAVAGNRLGLKLGEEFQVLALRGRGGMLLLRYISDNRDIKLSADELLNAEKLGQVRLIGDTSQLRWEQPVH